MTMCCRGFPTAIPRPASARRCAARRMRLRWRRGCARLPADMAAAAQADIAANRLAEVDGWLVPESVMLLAALAARTAVAKR